MPLAKLKSMPKAKKTNKENMAGGAQNDEPGMAGNTSGSLSNYSWSSQNILTSTAMTTSLTSNSTRMSITQKSRDMGKKTKKKAKKKLLNVVQFSSDDDDITAIIPKQTPTDVSEVITKAKLPQTSMHTPKGFGKYSEELTSKYQAKFDFPKALSEKHISSLNRIRMLWDQSHADSSVPGSSSSSHCHMSSSLSSQTSEKFQVDNITKKKGIRKKKKAIVSKKSALYNAVTFSSESDLSDVEQSGGKPTKKFPQKPLIKDGPPKKIKTSSRGKTGPEASAGKRSPVLHDGTYLKSFVLNSSSDDSSDVLRTKRLSIGDHNVIVPCTQDISDEVAINPAGNNEEISTVPSSQQTIPLEDQTNPDNFVPCTETMESDKSCELQSDSELNVKHVNIVTCSQTGDFRGETRNRSDNSSIHVPESESIESDHPGALMEVGMDVDVVPCTQDEQTQQDDCYPKEANEIWCNSTQGLVGDMVTILNAQSQHSAETSIKSRMQEPIPVADTLAVNSSNQKKQPRHKKKFFELIQFSDEDKDSPNITKTASTFVDHMSDDSVCSVQSAKSVIYSDLAQKLRETLSRFSKKSPNGPASKRLAHSSSKESSYEKCSNVPGGEVVVIPDSDQSDLPDRIGQSVLVADTDSVDSDPLPHPPDISIPDSQDTGGVANLKLQLSVSGSTPYSSYGTQQTTVRHVSAPDESPYLNIQKNISLQVSLVSEDDDFSPVIPLMPDQPENYERSKSRHLTEVDRSNVKGEDMHVASSNRKSSAISDNWPEVRNMSLQVSLRTAEAWEEDNQMNVSSHSESDSPSTVPTNQSERNLSYAHDEAETCGNNKSLQVSLSQGGSGELENSPDLSDTEGPVMMNMTVFTTPPEHYGSDGHSSEDTWMSPQGSPALSNQLSVPSQQNEKQQGLYEAGGKQDEGKPSFSLARVIRTPSNLLEDEEEGGQEEDGEEEDGQEAASHSGVCNLSLQVSMCVESVPGEESEDSDSDNEVVGNVVRNPVSRLPANSSDSDQDSDEPVATWRPRKVKRRTRPVFESDSDNPSELDDSDADPDFEASTGKQKVKPRGREKDAKNKGSVKKTPVERLVEAQAIRSVLLCEKRESVQRRSSDLEEDDDDANDNDLPDLTPSPRHRQPVFDSSDEEPTSERAVRQTKGRGSIDDFIVNDEDLTSDEDDSIFYVHTNRELEVQRAHRIQFDGPGDVFKTPRHFDCLGNPQPGGHKMTSKWTSKTPAPNRAKQHLVDSIRPHSTGHRPQFKGFLKSLSADLTNQERHPEAKRFVQEFKKHREELTEKLFKMYNETIFDNQLPGDLTVQWNSRLTTTAGCCAYKKDKAAPNGNGRITRIELSVKVCDSAERVRDTLVHELCHAAVWLIFGKNDGHGQYWRSFAHKAMRVHPDLPSISRCHMYDIHHKYIYKCCKCGQQIGRHTKSLNTEKKVCGICRGKFEVLLNTPNGLAAQTPRTPNRFAMFVKENYANIKKPGLKHADVMKALSAEFAAKNKIQT